MRTVPSCLYKTINNLVFIKYLVLNFKKDYVTLTKVEQETTFFISAPIRDISTNNPYTRTNAFTL